MKTKKELNKNGGKIMKKRIISLFLAVFMIVGMLPISAIPAFAEEDGNLTNVSYMFYDAGTEAFQQGVCPHPMLVKSDTTVWESGWYVVSGKVEIPERVWVTGNVYLILTDGCQLTVTGGINVDESNSFTVFAQSAGTGELTSANDVQSAGIGGDNKQNCGTIVIHGGIITATGRLGAGIGGGQHGNGGTVIIYGGKITATGGNMAAGIGGGIQGACGDVVIYGGTIKANGGSRSAGIGGSYSSTGGQITINGGAVTATGGEYAAGIGSGSSGAGCLITINGGTVTANGGRETAGIFAAVTVNGGSITAAGNSNAGIIGEITVNGGVVKSKGTTGINCPITINGGTVFASAEDGPAIKADGNVSDSGTICVSDDIRLLNLDDGTYFTKTDVQNWTDVLSGQTVSVFCEKINEPNAPVPYLAYDTEAGCFSEEECAYGDFRFFFKNMTELTTGTYIVCGIPMTVDMIDINGDVSLILIDGCDLTVNGGVKVNVGNSLTIYAQSLGSFAGKLTTKGVYDYDRKALYYAGIGGGQDVAGGTVTINGGTVTAHGGDFGAGIGGGRGKSNGIVTINGGTVTAIGGDQGAGIGGGFRLPDEAISNGIVTINGGTVTAHGGQYAAGIGGGHNESGGTVTISGGSVTANGGYCAAGIGGGNGGSGGTVTIDGGSVTANGGDGAAGIGGGNAGNGETITISGGIVAANGGGNGAGIGGGNSLDNGYTGGNSGTVIISGGTVTATGGDCAAGIGGGYTGRCGIVTISGGTVTAIGGTDTAGIGRGYRFGYIGDDLDIELSIKKELLVYNNDTKEPITRTGEETWARAIGIVPVLITEGDEPDPEDEGIHYLEYMDGMFDEKIFTGEKYFPWDPYTGNLENNWYVAEGNVTIDDRVAVIGDAKLILTDGCTLKFLDGIEVNAGSSLTVYAQSEGENIGKLIATGSYGSAGIGGDGKVIIHGGNIKATGSVGSYGVDGGAGIGSGAYGGGCDVTIYGGDIEAQGADGGAGIGSGYYEIEYDYDFDFNEFNGLYDNGTAGSIAIYGGNIIATGGYNSAGIGGGYGCDGGTVEIYGGTVTATGGETGSFNQADGIGCGWFDVTDDWWNVYYSDKVEGGTVTIDDARVISNGKEISHKHDFTSGIYKSNEDGTHSQKCLCCDEYGPAVAHAFADGKCACGAVCDAPMKIKSASLHIAEDINVIYAAELSEDYTDPYMVFTLNDRTYTVDTYTVNSKGQYCFEFENVTPQCMGDNISATLYATVNGCTASVTKAEYSVRTYCTNLLAKTDDELLITLLSDLLTYGAAAQTYTNYKTDTLVTDGLSLFPSTFTELSGLKEEFVGTEDPNTFWKSAGLTLRNNVDMNLFFCTDNVEGLSVVLEINGRTETVTDFAPVDGEEGLYQITFHGILATEFDLPVLASFYRDGAQVGNTLSYSVNTYICSKQHDGDAALAAMVQALYNYGATANTYYFERYLKQ